LIVADLSRVVFQAKCEDRVEIGIQGNIVPEYSGHSKEYPRKAADLQQCASLLQNELGL